MIKGIGIDLVEVERIRQSIKRQGRKFMERVFTPAEIKYCLKRKRFLYQHFAVRFASKEAFLKALGTGWGAKNSPYWTEIEIQKLPDKPPRIILKGKALQHISKLKAKQIHLSLTHTSTYASAIVILEG
jgi:holo-[acyl-carrier protein] synthase